MLNNKEKMVLTYYALLPKLIRASIWMIPGVILLTFLLEYINEVYTYGHSSNDSGITMTISVIIFFIIAHIWGRIALKNASRNATWQSIVQRIEAVYIRPSGDELSLADISKAKKSAYFSNFDQCLHEAFHIFEYYPKTTLLGVIFVVLPCLFIVGSYIPTYIQNYTAYEVSCAEVSKVMATLSDAFDGYEIYYYDPYEYYSEYGYSFMAYTENNNFEDYIIVDVLNDGSIDYVSYSLTVDLTIDKEDNLEDMQDRLNQFYELLVSADVTSEDKHLTEPILSDSFIAAFLEDDEYQYITYGQGDVYIDFYVSSIYNDRGTLYIFTY